MHCLSIHITYSVKKKSRNIPGDFRAANVANFLFQEFISNFPEKFRNINCEIQKFLLKEKKEKIFVQYTEKETKTDFE